MRVDSNPDASLLNEVRSLKKSRVGRLVDARLKEFEKTGCRQSCFIFEELCFCILTANYTADRAMIIQDKVGQDFLKLSEKKLAKKLKEFGHRFPNTRAGYIVAARRHERGLKKTLKSFKNEKELRDWIAENVKGLGMKEASHFLRNIGYKNLAIIDFHIIDVLVKHWLVERPKTLTRRRYLEIEEGLEGLAGKLGITLAELDLYLWYMETGRILK
jgi:N-glycosylase/DNA lyase